MQKDLILTDAEKEARRQTVARNRQKREQASKAQSLDIVCMIILINIRSIRNEFYSYNASIQ